MRRPAGAALALLLLLGAARAAAAQDCDTELKNWDQCGGLSGSCATPGCNRDGPWPGTCCPEGSKCVRNDGHFFNCQPPPGANSNYGPAPPPRLLPEPPVKARLHANGARPRPHGTLLLAACTPYLHACVAYSHACMRVRLHGACMPAHTLTPHTRVSNHTRRRRP